MSLRSIFVVCAGANLLGGCVGDAAQPLYRVPYELDRQWPQIRKECRFEAAKATANSGWNWKYVYRECLTFKGVIYVASFAMPDGQWEALRSRCHAEAETTLAGQPPTRKRFDEMDDIEIGCIERSAGHRRLPD
jgi:hypothetical protein